MVPDTLKSYLSYRLQIDNLRIQPIGGGCINDCYRISNSQRSYFCKINSATKFPHLFQREAEGLQLLATQNIIRTPSIIDYFTYNGFQVLLLEWITPGEKTSSFWTLLGEKLAHLHRTFGTSYGLEMDNYMGSIIQQNNYTDQWDDFFIKNRLQPLLDKSIQLNLVMADFEKKIKNIFPRISETFTKEPPALLHGDLWNGNLMADSNSNPVLIDPAVYYGHLSVDLGMTNLFGGFDKRFYDSYNYHYPLPSNHKEQWMLANLYPLFIHLILFGKSYLPQIENIVNEFQ